MERSKGEQAFIDQMTRRLLVQWADYEVVWSGASIQDPGGVQTAPNVYVEHALAKGWLTKRTPHRLTAKGFQVAASFLKR